MQVAMREAVCLRIVRYPPGSTAEKNREQSHIPVDDVVKGQNRSLGSAKKFAVLTEHKKL